jgi:hypothetical protein
MGQQRTCQRAMSSPQRPGRRWNKRFQGRCRAHLPPFLPRKAFYQVAVDGDYSFGADGSDGTTLSRGDGGGGTQGRSPR